MMDGPAPVLAVDGLSIRFGASGPALVDNVSFSLWSGETLCLVGKSGCGKSLTALALMGLLPPGARPAGRALFEGRDLLTLPVRQMQDLRGDRMAMIFQEPMTSLNPAFRVGDQIAESIVRHRSVYRARRPPARARDVAQGPHSRRRGPV